MKLRQFTRVIKIAYVWQRYGLDESLFVIPWLKPLKPLRWLNPTYWFVNRKKTYPERLCLALEALGPLFIKFGQVLSTRADLFTEDIAHALSDLQDNVKPFDSNVAHKIIERALKQPLTDIFKHLDKAPLASASVAQVHSGVLHNDKEVVVKVLRPGINKVIKQDIALLYTLARLLDRHWSRAKRMHLIEIVEELERTLLNELNLMREAANASQLRRNCKHRDVYIPEIYWDLCCQNVMVMERVHGVPVTHIKVLKEHGVDLKKLAERGIEMLYTQVFKDCFFHADMHPGNVFVNLKDPADPTYILLDFGIVGTLDEQDKHYLAGNFLAFFKRDYRHVAELHIESGWVPADTRIMELESAIRAVCEPIFEKPLKDISMGKTLFRLIQMARQFHVEIQPQLILLQKTLLNIEGIGRQLDPNLDLWATAKPFLEKWMKQQIGVTSLLKRIRKQLPTLSERIPEMPELIYNYLKHQQPGYAGRPPIQAVAQNTHLSRRISTWRSVMIGIGVGLCVVGGLAITQQVSHQWLGQFVLQHASMVGIIGAVILIFGLWRIRR